MGEAETYVSNHGNMQLLVIFRRYTRDIQMKHSRIIDYLGVAVGIVGMEWLHTVPSSKLSDGHWPTYGSLFHSKPLIRLGG